MGRYDRAKALKGIVSGRIARGAAGLDGRFDSAVSRAVKRGASSTVRATRTGATAAKQAALEAAGRNGHLVKTGDLVRKGTAELAALPWFSLASDAAAARSGVRDAVKAARKHPGEPLPAVRLAECLRRSEADLRAYRIVRTAVHPTSLVARTGLRAGAALGQEGPARRQSELAARRAAAVAVDRLRARPGDGDALEALARAALLQGRASRATGVARAAVSASSGAGGPLVTLARAHMAAGERADAARVAALAVRRGCTVGYEVLADLCLRDAPSADHRAQVAAYERLMARVDAKDFRSYYGVRRTAGSFARQLLLAQSEKTWRATERALRYGGRTAVRAARRDTTKGGTQQ
jgi:hypothetical protein